ncbi:MAG: hypothetical protein ACO4AD_04320, partial [Pseudomonadales bacterium]
MEIDAFRHEGRNPRFHEHLEARPVQFSRVKTALAHLSKRITNAKEFISRDPTVFAQLLHTEARAHLVERKALIMPELLHLEP